MSIQQVQALEDRIRLALRERRDGEVTRLWEEIHRLSPSHVAALTALGQRAVQRGDFRAARGYFEALLGADPQNPEHCGNLALICRELGDDGAEEVAIKRALTIDPLDLLGLILRAERYERSGDRHRAASAYGAVANVAPDPAIIAPHLRGAVEKAMTYRAAYDKEFGAYLDTQLHDLQGSGMSAGSARFRESVDIMVGRKRRYESRSAMFHYAGLPLVEFIDRGQLPFLDAFEAHTSQIREEFLAVFRADAGFEPYINYDADQPVNQWAELNHNPRWSAFHLLKDGVPVLDNASRCPLTMSLLAGAPQPDQPGKTPVAMFSLLKPRTRIPPHCGVSNVRLVTHVPLIVPSACGFRVGNTTREWEVGKAWVFDDTIEHEAWNESDQLRVVLIFDVWNPFLSDEERQLITALSRSINAYRGDTGGADL